MIKNFLILLIFLISLSALIISIFALKTKTTTEECGKSGHFSHSSGGGKFSWNALRLFSYKGIKNPYLFVMFETYIDGTSDHYIVDIINLPDMTSELITIDGKHGILHIDNLTVSVPNNKSKQIIEKEQKKFFDTLPCYSGSYSGRGIQ